LLLLLWLWLWLWLLLFCSCGKKRAGWTINNTRRRMRRRMQIEWSTKALYTIDSQTQSSCNHSTLDRTSGSGLRKQLEAEGGDEGMNRDDDGDEKEEMGTACFFFCFFVQFFLVAKT
jgi:hypothetical protein